MRTLFVLILLCFSTSSYAQNQDSNQILEEGKLLYRLEKASWYSTDHFLATFRSKIDSIGGYISYENDEHKVNSIYYSRFNPEQIFARYTFDSIPNQKPIVIDSEHLTATELEKNLITILNDARNKAMANEDGFFKFYKQSGLNFIPVISDQQRAVFVITGPKVANLVLLGNDYKLEYNNKNEFINKEKLHNSLISFKTNNLKEEYLSMHSHVVTDLITSTDICNLLLYKNYVDWKKHIVISDDEVSIFDLQEESLVIMKREAWDTIYSDEMEYLQDLK